MARKSGEFVGRDDYERSDEATLTFLGSARRLLSSVCCGAVAKVVGFLFAICNFCSCSAEVHIERYVRDEEIVRTASKSESYPVLSTFADLFDVMARRDVVRRRIVGGETLIAPHTPPDNLYLVRSGLLAVSDSSGVLLGLVGAGEIVGEMAILTAERHFNQVTALRDGIIDALPAKHFLEHAAATPTLMASVAKVIAMRSQSRLPPAPPARAILVASIDPGLDPHQLCAWLAAACVRDGLRATTADQASAASENWLDIAEHDHNLVLIAAAWDEPEWSARCQRQVDRVLLLASADNVPRPDCGLCASEPMQTHQRVDLVIEHQSLVGRRSVSAWASETRAARVFHVDRYGDGIDRLARIMTGRSTGIVLSGGGARAFAHIGVLARLRESGIPIDLVGGTSMGAIVAAGLAAGWDDRDMDVRIRRAFVETNPLDDIAVPILAMTRGRKVEKRLREHFGDLAIEDLEIPFFCVSTDLTGGHHRLHHRGRLDHALRASISLPGILPPVVEGDSVLVDGAVLRNLPTDIMRRMHEGLVVASDVGRDIALTPEALQPPSSWLRWFLSGAWRGGPPIVSVLMRAATVATNLEIAAAKDAADVYIMPELSGIEIRDWQAYPQAVAAGRAAACAAADHLQNRQPMRAATGRELTSAASTPRLSYGKPASHQ